MKFWEILRFELAYRLRRVSTWAYFGVFIGLAYFMFEGVMIQEARGSGNVYADAPFLVGFSILAAGMMGIAVTAALFVDAATRDARSGIDPLFYTMPIDKSAYLGGRFLGTFLVNAALLFLVPVALMIGPLLMPGSAELFGPFRLVSHIQPYFVFGIVNLLVSAAAIFAAAALSRKALAGYGCGLVLFLGSMIAYEALGKSADYRLLAALIDPFGFTAIEVLTSYWTPAERNVELLGLEGVVLWNRLIWMAVALGLLALAYARFGFAHNTERSRRLRSQAVQAPDPAPARRAPVGVPHTARSFGLRAQLGQALAVAKRSFVEMLTTRYFPVILTAALAFLIINGVDAGYVLDTPTWPVTSLVAQGVLGDLTVFVYIVLGLYAGEIIWMERDARMSEISDPTPARSWSFLAGKFGALVLALITFQLVMMAGGILVQVMEGYYEFDLAVWIQVLFGFQLVDYVLMAVLALVLHVLSDQKYLGHIVFILYAAARVFPIVPDHLSVEHNLLRFAGDPGWLYSQLSGFEPFAGPYFWFNFYWAAFAVLLAVVANLFWVRSRERSFVFRWQTARLRMTGRTVATAAIAASLLLATGGFIFYNTNVLNEYRPSDELIALKAEYEKRYKQYDGIAQPEITDATFQVEIYPDERSADLSGSYVLLNKTDIEIDSIHMMIPPVLDVRSASLDRGARQVIADDVFGYHVHALDTPLATGDSLRFSFELQLAPRGFENEHIESSVVGNGTYLNRSWLPVVGYQADEEIRSSQLRREHGLPPRERMMSPHHEAASLQHPQNTAWFDYEAVIGTDSSQIAVAPGALRRTWTQGGRRYFHYASEAPVKNVFAFLSADYAVHEARWRDVDIEIYFHPDHAFNVEEMVRGSQAALQYMSEAFGPYPYRQLRIAELPKHHGSFASALPGLVAYSESFGFVARTEGGINYPFVVTAHEVAHQWWGGQFAPAEVQGQRVLYESLAHYSALMALESTYGAGQVRGFLDMFSHRYLVGRQNRSGMEVPLMQSEDQNYIHYHKGALVMYALKEYLGEDSVNGALRRLLDAHRFGGPPYPTTVDLYRELQNAAPDSLRYLVTDLFEDITLWELRTNDARAELIDDGVYRVTLDVETYKLRSDSLGRDGRVPMEDYVEIGLYAGSADEDEAAELIYLEKHRVASGQNTITVTVPQKPARSGIDPRHLLIERQRGDNLRDVRIQ